MWNPERGLADRSCFFFALFSGCRLRSDRMLFLSHLKWRVTMSNTIKGDTITITIKVIMAYTISHHPSHPDQSHPQSSMAAPAEEAAQLLRVKRCIFYIIFKLWFLTKVSSLIIDGPQAGGWRHPERLRSKHRDRGIPAFPSFPRNLRWERLRRCRGLWEIKSRKRKTKNKQSLTFFLFSAPSACKERMLVPIGIEIYRGM